MIQKPFFLVKPCKNRYNQLMITRLIPWILYFFIYAIAGYVVEIIFCSLRDKKLTNRGFLFGPVLPIYGFGMILVLRSTLPVRDNFALTFLVAMFVCSALEYATSWAMEKLFGIKWWDYSKSDRWNLNGRICLRNCLAFGIAGCIITNQIHPIVETFVASFGVAQPVIAVVLLALILLDVLASTYAVEKVKHSIRLKLIPGDQTYEVKKLAGHAIAQLLTGKNHLERRIAELQKDIERRRLELERHNEARHREFIKYRTELRKKLDKRKNH